jgi:hypothetical protein
VDPQSRPGEFSPAGGGRRPVGIRPGLGRPARSSPAGCTFSGAECHDRFGGGQEPGGKVTRGAFGRSRERTSRRGGHVAGPRTLAAATGFGPSGRVRLGSHCSQWSQTARLVRARLAGVASGQWRIGRQPTRPVLKHGPRSLACARVMGSHETQRRNESEGRLRLAQAGSRPLAGRAHCRPVSTASSARRSKSAHAGTRKMVNYA